MGQVSIRINGYMYNIGCRNGEEEHVYDMAQKVETWVQRARSLGGASSESKTLAMAALLMADEIHELRQSLSSARLPKDNPDKEVHRARLFHLAEKAEELVGQLQKEC